MTTPHSSLLQATLRLSTLVLVLLALSPPGSIARDKVKPFTEGPWGTVFLNPEAESTPENTNEPEPESRGFFSKLLPGSKTETAPAPKPKTGSGFRLPWTKPRATPEPPPAPKSKSKSFLGFLNRDSDPQSETASVEEIRFEPRADPAPTPEPAAPAPAAAATPKTASPGLLGMFNRKQDKPATAPEPPAAPAEKKSEGFLSRLNWKTNTEPEPAPAPEPEAPKESSGFLTFLKPRPKPAPEPAPEPDTEAEAEVTSSGFLTFFKPKPKAKPEPEPEPEPQAASTAPRRKAADNIPEQREGTPQSPRASGERDKLKPAAESSGFLTFFKPKPKPAAQPAAEVTLEREPAPEAESFLARLKPQPKAPKTPAPAPAPKPAPAPPAAAPTFSDKPASDAAIAAALETEPAAPAKTGGFFARMRPGSSKPAAAQPEPEPEKAPEPEPIPAPKFAPPTVTFANDIQPIFDSKCVRCHNRDTLHGRVSLESRALAFEDTPAGSIIVPGSPEQSILMQNISTARTATKSMPPVGHNVTRKEKNLIYAWIKEGAQ